MNFKKYFIFENNANIKNINEFIEMNNFYLKIQQSERIIKYIQTKKFNLKEFKQLLKLTTNIAKCKNIENDYKLNIEFIDELFLVITETFSFKEKIYKKDHIFYSV
jgi:hypothetical protein